MASTDEECTPLPYPHAGLTPALAPPSAWAGLVCVRFVWGAPGRLTLLVCWNGAHVQLCLPNPGSSKDQGAGVKEKLERSDLTRLRRFRVRTRISQEASSEPQISSERLPVSQNYPWSCDYFWGPSRNLHFLLLFKAGCQILRNRCLDHSWRTISLVSIPIPQSKQ